MANRFWKYATTEASNLSELSLTLGDVSSAVRQGEQSVELADRSGDASWRMISRMTLATALFCAGDFGRMKTDDDSPFILPPSSFASAAFREAEAMQQEMQQEMQPQYPLLYSTPGYQYCELLLADVCLRIRELNIECRTRNVEIRSEGEQTDESHNKPIASDTSTSSTSALDIPCSTFDIQSTARELQSESESL